MIFNHIISNVIILHTLNIIGVFVLYKIKKNNYQNYYNKHDKFLIELPKITQQSKYFKILYSPKEFNKKLLHAILHAHKHIYLVTLYLEHDQGGQEIINAILYIKKIKPTIKVKIIVDWYRAQRTKFGTTERYTNSNWYKDITKNYPNIEISIFGIPISINEALGVFHIKGFIIDDTILYSGASLNNEYLHISSKYRYDRYHIIQNSTLSNVMLNYIESKLINSKIINNIQNNNFFTKINKNKIRLFRKKLRKSCYSYQNNANFQEFSITPLIGLGKKSILNQTVYHLISATKQKIILCTPYFNIPHVLTKILHNLLYQKKSIEIIVGDKTANDFYNPNQEYKPFKIISILPYLYEINLRFFIKKLQNFIDNEQLIINIWKDKNNGYHIKGIWIDNEWQLLTGNNLNPRGLRLDLENALLIHDPLYELKYQKIQELKKIKQHTYRVTHYKNLPKISNYPPKIKKMILRIQKIKFDKLINRLL